MEEDTSVMELSLRLSALRRAFLLHVLAVDTVVRGHAEMLALSITNDLEVLSEEMRAWVYGEELEGLRDDCRAVVEARARLEREP